MNRLALNVGKTNFVIFRGKKKVYHNVTLILNRKALEQKDHVKYLGVFMDEHLNWKYHISHVIKKISRGIGILGRLRSYMKPNQVLMPFDKASGYLKLEFHSHHELAMLARYT